jgi:hypothetical protein
VGVRPAGVEPDVDLHVDRVVAVLDAEEAHDVEVEAVDERECGSRSSSSSCRRPSRGSRRP